MAEEASLAASQSFQPPRSPLTPKNDLPIGLESMLYKRDGVATQGSTPQSLKDSNAAAMDRLLSFVLGPLLQHSSSPDRPVLGLLNCASHIERLVNTIMEKSAPLPWETERGAETDGRVGSRHTEVPGNDRTPFDGTELFAEGFRTFQGNTCVFRGKWQYEVSLVTYGDMQLGWCCNTHNSRSSLMASDGGGHEACSYSYNGRRKLKYSLGQWPYGVEWLDGDVVGCLIDMDAGTVSFTRNGQDLGVAFESVIRGPGHAYIPFVSVSSGQKCIINFGSRPLRYPAVGHRALIDPVPSNYHAIASLLDCLRRLSSIGSGSLDASSPVTTAIGQLRKSLGKVSLVLGHHLIVPFLSAYFQKGVYSYLTSSVLVPFLIELDDPVTEKNALAPRPVLACFLNLLVSLMDPTEHLPLLLKFITEAIHLVHGFSPLQLNLHPQLAYSALLLGILRHPRCRWTIVGDDKIRFNAWFGYATNGSIPAPSSLKEMIPSVWWEGCTVQDEQHCKKRYEEATTALVRQCTVLDRIYEAICKSVLEDNSEYDPAVVYLESPQVVLARQLRLQCRSLPANPGPEEATETTAITLLTGLAAPLMKSLWSVWDDLVPAHPNVLPAKDLCMLDSMFYDTSGQCEEYTRLGGSLAHLCKEHHDVLEKEIASNESLEDDYADFAGLLELIDTMFLIYHNWGCKDLILCAQCFHQIKELNTSLEKYRALRDKAERDGTAELATLACVGEYLKQTQAELERNTRTVSCFRASTFSKDMAEILAWSCRVTMAITSRFLDREELFGFLPEHYVRVMCDTFFSLRALLHPIHNFFSRKDSQALVEKMALLLCRIVPNKYMVLPDAHDMATQYLGMLCCLPEGRKAISQLPLDPLKKLYLHVMEAFSEANNHNWVQAMVVAARLWMIPSFADHAIPPLTVSPEMAVEEVVAFLENDVFSAEFVKYPFEMAEREVELLKQCLEDTVTSTGLLNAVLNRLNWAFSELVGIMQELQAKGTNVRKSQDYERRLCRTCAFSFTLVVMFLRLIERLALLAPAIWVSKSHPTSAIMMPRLCQTLGQILTRFATRGSLFEQLPAHILEALTDVKPAHLLTACAGVFLSLSVRCAGDMQECGLERIVQETGLDLVILCEIMGVDLTGSRKQCLSGSTPVDEQGGGLDTAAAAAAAAAAAQKSSFHGFSLRDVENVSAEERALVARFVDLLEAKVLSLRDAQDGSDTTENLCSICCAQALSVKFVPCNHQSCMACISYQMMNDPRCFFCKEEVKSFVSIDDDNAMTASAVTTATEDSGNDASPTWEGTADSEGGGGMVRGSVEPPAKVRIAENRTVEGGNPAGDGATATSMVRGSVEPPAKVCIAENRTVEGGNPAGDGATATSMVCGAAVVGDESPPPSVAESMTSTAAAAEVRGGFNAELSTTSDDLLESASVGADTAASETGGSVAMEIDSEAFEEEEEEEEDKMSETMERRSGTDDAMECA